MQSSHFVIRRIFAIIAPLAVLASGCVSTAQRVLPEASAWRRAASSALRDRDTWIPAVAALAVVATDSDGKISRWASDETPVFGSRDNAEEMSNYLKGAVHVLMLGSALAPAREPKPFTRRVLTAAGNELATLPNDVVIGAFKRSTGRERPDESDRAAFPSGHASAAASYAAITERNLEEVHANEGTRRATMIVARVLVAATAWARVEADRHYPTDVFAGIAIGNAVTSLVDRAYRGDGRAPIRPAVSFERSRSGYRVIVAIRLQ